MNHLRTTPAAAGPTWITARVRSVHAERCLLVALGLAASAAFAAANDASLLQLSLEELMNLPVGVASNVVADVRKQPVSVTTLQRDMIRNSGARTLSEVLAIYVPGYMLVEDQDDTIAAFRGVAPDNNSKVMLQLNGQNLNTEWFWGPPDAILNGLDLDYIERIEVIRGPGSVTLGQGALLGVINIITRKGGVDDNGAEVLLAVGEHGLSTRSVGVNLGQDGRGVFLYASRGNYDGEPVRDEGWARATVDQGLSVFERQHHLKRGEFSNVLANLSHGPFEANFLHFDQVRDLYNWKRDREAVGQVLDGVNASYTFGFSEARSLKVSVHGERDDYALYTHGGNLPTPARQAFESGGSSFASIANSLPGLANATVAPGVAGGVREERQGIKLLGKIDDLLPRNRLALGGEYNRFEMGLADARGNNFIINEEIQRLGLVPDGAGGFIVTGNVNDTNTWVKRDTVEIGSLFVEDFYSVNEKLDLFGALRYDRHSNWGAQLSPRAGLIYSPSSQHTLRLSWQSGFRGAVGVQFAGGFVQDGFLAQQNFPVVNAINNGGPGDYIDTDFDGDPTNDRAVLHNVEPETMKSLDLAWSWFSAEKRLHTNVVLFHNTIEHILTAEGQGYGPGHGFGEKIGSDAIGTWNGSWFYQNQPGELSHWGIEAELEWQAGRFTLGASHALVRVEAANLGSLNVYALLGNQIVAYPEDITRFHIDAPLGRHWSAHYNHLWFWGFDLPNHGGNDGGHIGNLALNWSVPAMPELTLGLRVKNLWNEHALYPTRQGSADAGLGAPAIEGRSAWLTLDYKF